MWSRSSRPVATFGTVRALEVLLCTGSGRRQVGVAERRRACWERGNPGRGNHPRRGELEELWMDLVTRKERDLSGEPELEFSFAHLLAV